MGKLLYDAYPSVRSVYEEASSVLGYDVAALCFTGPAERLNLTEFTQPALLVSSMAAFTLLEPAGIKPVAVAGHSLGEYSALVAAGVLEFADAVRLVRARGRLMQEAVPEGEGAMAAILGLEAAAVEALAAEASEDGVCAAANFNAPEQTVVAGDRRAVERAVEIAKQRGAKRAVLLAVSAPFHSPLMAPARAGLEPLLEDTDFADAAVPVVTNVDALPVTEGAASREALGRQVDGAVRWVESIERMREEFAIETFIEIGPGSVLSGLIRRIAPGAQVVSLSETTGLEKLAVLEQESQG